ncbi:O-antigen ligase family protein [Escherichia coli]|uniref:O-antigen ligase family protein n=1 Tax=Escherichia coli TaxID=562 RepID=UPI000BE853B5|nr:O-antigen ligase family protein [Escherichia coli]
MQIVNKNSIALSLIYLAIVIITLIPFGRGNISGLEVSFPFFIFAIFFLLVKKNKVYDISFFANLFFTLWAVWVLCGITYSYFTFPGGVDHQASYLRYIRLLEMYLPGCMILSFLGEQPNSVHKKIVYLLILLFVIVTLEATVGFISQIDLLTATQMYKYPGFGYVFRAGGVAKDSSAYGSLVFLLGITALIELRKIRTNNRLLSFIIISCLLINIYISMSRSLIVSVALYFLIYICMEKKSRVKSFLILGVVSLFIFMYGLTNEYFLSFLNRLTGGEQTDISSGRFSTWTSLLVLISENPIFGVGYRLTTEKYNLIPDNMFLSLLVETGIIGFILYFSFLTCLLIYVIKYNRDKFPLLVAYIFSGFFIDISTFWVSVPVLFFVLAIRSVGNE